LREVADTRGYAALTGRRRVISHSSRISDAVPMSKMTGPSGDGKPKAIGLVPRRRRKIRHRIGARIGTDGDGDAIAESELPARGVAEKSIVLPGCDPLYAQLIEQAFIDTERPFLAPVLSAIVVVQIAEVVAGIVRGTDPANSRSSRKA
jgi:hypothetical protein